MVKVITAPSQVITTVDAKLHLRVTESDDDALIVGLIESARNYVEHYTGIAVGAQTLEIALSAFPVDEIELPMVATAITSIKYDNDAGVETTVNIGDYALDLYKMLPTVSPVFGETWPTARESLNCVRVRYTAGAAPTGAVRSAMLLIIGHLYENRESVNVGGSVSLLPMGVDALLNTVKVYE